MAPCSKPLTMPSTLYALSVTTPNGPRLVGPWYSSKAVCKSWVRRESLEASNA